MAYVDVGSWSAEHVVMWIRGLHGSMQAAPLDQLIRSRVNGKRLMLLTAQDLTELIPSIKIDALQTILNGINSLTYLNYNYRSDTLQSLTLNLACHAKYFNKQLLLAELSPRLLPVSTKTTTPMTGNSKNRFDFAKVDSNMEINQSNNQRVSLESLDSVSVIVDQIIRVVIWLNATGLTTKFNQDFRTIMLRVAVELTSTAQRDQFVELPNEILKKTSKFLADYCEWVVLAIDDPDFIQPCWLDVVSVKKKADEDFGIVLSPNTSGTLNIDEVVFSSPSHRSGRVMAKDEIVQVDYQTIIGWPVERVRDILTTYVHEVILTIKKKASQSSLNPSIVILKPYAIPLKRSISHNSESLHLTQDSDSLDQDRSFEAQASFVDDEGAVIDGQIALEPPKEPKGPVYELQSIRRRRELKRRVSISGSLSDALANLSLADSLPIPALEMDSPAISERLHAHYDSGSVHEASNSDRIERDSLTKSLSHDTAKLYLHTLSIDRKHLWLPLRKLEN